MASGHVNRTKRPNTWLHRPACDVKILLANPEPSTHGPERHFAATPRYVRTRGTSRPVMLALSLAAIRALAMEVTPRRFVRLGFHFARCPNVHLELSARDAGSRRTMGNGWTSCP
jgi:hypothetical protein